MATGLCRSFVMLLFASMASPASAEIQGHQQSMREYAMDEGTGFPVIRVIPNIKIVVICCRGRSSLTEPGIFPCSDRPRPLHEDYRTFLVYNSIHELPLRPIPPHRPYMRWNLYSLRRYPYRRISLPAHAHSGPLLLFLVHRFIRTGDEFSKRDGILRIEARHADTERQFITSFVGV